jgi:Ca2+-binding RTX toxin-like protein
MAIINGNNNPNVLVGTALADSIFGFGGNDSLYGFDGNDYLDGGTGNDYMAGGAGNDTYVVDNISDTVFEAAGAGIDKVNASVNYVLEDNVENLSLFGGAIAGIGNGRGNTIIGNANANFLAGQGGNDNLDGGLGNDHLDGGIGNDTMFGGSGNDGLSGRSGNDYLNGGSGNDYLDGGSGNDTLVGGLGNDVLDGGSGADRFYFAEAGAANWDSIVDFSHVSDTIALSSSLDGVFGGGIAGLSFNLAGVLNAGWYFEGAGFNGNGLQLSGIFNDTTTGNIWYNRTSGVAFDSVLLANVGAGSAALDQTDFILV